MAPQLILEVAVSNETMPTLTQTGDTLFWAWHRDQMVGGHKIFSRTLVALIDGGQVMPRRMVQRTVSEPQPRVNAYRTTKQY
jgi:hypothetical protein